MEKELEGFACRRDGVLEAIGYIFSGNYIAVIRYSRMSKEGLVARISTKYVLSIEFMSTCHCLLVL